MTVTLSARALLLDMDGTLVDSTPVVNRIWSEWAVDHDVDVEDVLHRAHGRQGHDVMAEFLPDRPQEENVRENDLMLAREVAETEGIVEIPGAAEFLASLAGLPHALVTSANEPLAAGRMAAAGLSVPSIAVMADDVAASKPDPEGFLKAAGILGVDPADCIVFEDSRAGITAARAAGMRVIGVGDAAAFEPDHVVPDLTAVTVTPTPDGVEVTVRS